MGAGPVMRAVRAFLLLLAALLALPAFAYTATNVTTYNTGGHRASTHAASCTAYVAAITPNYAYYFENSSPTICYYKSGTYPSWGTITQTIVQEVALGCPGGGTLSGSQCVCSGGDTDTGSSCQVYTNACTAGKDLVTIRSITAGWDRKQFSNQLSPELKPDGTPAPDGFTGFPAETSCIDGCTMTRGDVVDAYTSAQPTNEGYYRQSYDWEFTGTGVECTPVANDTTVSDENAPPPPCDGFKGYVDGRLSCVAKVPNNGNVTGPKTTKTVGNPQAGSTPEQPGRVPTENGNGGNKGGPPHPKDGTVILPDGTMVSGTGTTATGTTPSPEAGEEQAACGAPGQPKCKIDETGTPSPVAIDGAMGGAGGQVDGSGDSAKSKITEAQGIQRPPWTWAFALPTACSPLELEAFGFTVNVCEWQPMFHDLMSFVWGVIGVFAGLGMLSRAMTNGS